MENQFEEWREWVVISQQELRGAVEMGKLYPPLLEISCYLAQQSSEKILKAFLCYHEQNIPKSHDLLKLCLMCEELDSDFEKLAPLCAKISIYATDTRYPNRSQITTTDRDAAENAATEIQQFVKTKLETK